MVFWPDLWEDEDVDFYEDSFTSPASDDLNLEMKFWNAFVDSPNQQSIKDLRDYLDEEYDIDLDDVFDWDVWREYYNEHG